MKQEVNPTETRRKEAFNLWMKSPMPMVTLTKTLNVSSLCGISRRKGLNPMVMWGCYRKGWLRTTLPISFQFHHVQMDGGQAARFLEELQKTIDTI